MKLFIGGVLSVFLTLFALSTFTRSSAAEDRARQYFAEKEIAQGLQFVFERRLLYWSNTLVHLVFWFWVVFSGLGRRLAAGLGGSRRWFRTLLGMVLLWLIAEEALALPFGIARWAQQTSWGMTTRPLADWLAEHFLGFAVSTATYFPLVVGLYVLLRWFPRTWWLWATAGGAVFAMAYAWMLPVLIAPLFNTFTPLRETRWAELGAIVEALTARAGVHVNDILVVDASRQGSHTNAYFTGFGSTRQIVLYDTLLEKHTPAEIESILAHELGHWQHNHIVKGIALGTLAVLVGFFVLGRILRGATKRPPFLLESPADPAGLPLMMLAVLLGSWLAMPVENAISRHFERQADEASLELAGQADAFIQAEIKLARENKSNVAPTPFNVWLFASHPPTIERIAMAERFKMK